MHSHLFFVVLARQQLSAQACWHTQHILSTMPFAIACVAARPQEDSTRICVVFKFWVEPLTQGTARQPSSGADGDKASGDAAEEWAAGPFQCGPPDPEMSSRDVTRPSASRFALGQAIPCTWMTRRRPVSVGAYVLVAVSGGFAHEDSRLHLPHLRAPSGLHLPHLRGPSAERLRKVAKACTLTFFWGGKVTPCRIHAVTRMHNSDPTGAWMTALCRGCTCGGCGAQ